MTQITPEQILMGRAKIEDLPEDLQNNLNILVEKINKLQTAYGKPFKINSGYRTPEINAATPGASANSWHMKCGAVDIADIDDELMNWTLQNLKLIEEIGLWMENFNFTPTWVHYQIFSPKSGSRIFIPYSGKAPSNRWDGKL